MYFNISHCNLPSYKSIPPAAGVEVVQQGGVVLPGRGGERRQKHALAHIQVQVVEYRVLQADRELAHLIPHHVFLLLVPFPRPGQVESIEILYR